MKTKSGFTIVEVMTVITIVAILSSIAILSYIQVQKNTRDTTRQGTVTVVVEALEKYYTKNGEYPSVRSLANNYVDITGAVVGTKLTINPGDLKMPQTPAGTTNPITSAATPANDYIAYIGTDTVDNNSCQNVLTGGCQHFTVKYNKETGGLVTIEGRHQ